MRLALVMLLVASSAQAQSVAPWWKPYEADEVKGEQVLGFWRFDDQASLTTDQSSHKHKAGLRGAKFHAEGRFGGCLESGAGYPESDTSHSIHVANADALSPRGPFTAELWIQPKPGEDQQDRGRVVLMDRKYVTYDHSGFMLSLNRVGAQTRTMTVAIGLGDRSETWQSRPFELTAKQWRHIAFTYDANGTVTFFVDGSEMGDGAIDASVGHRRSDWLAVQRLSGIHRRSSPDIRPARLPPVPLRTFGQPIRVRANEEAGENQRQTAQPNLGNSQRSHGGGEVAGRCHSRNAVAGAAAGLAPLP